MENGPFIEDLRSNMEIFQFDRLDYRRVTENHQPNKRWPFFLTKNRPRHPRRTWRSWKSLQIQIVTMRTRRSEFSGRLDHGDQIRMELDFNGTSRFWTSERMTLDELGVKSSKIFGDENAMGISWKWVVSCAVLRKFDMAHWYACSFTCFFPLKIEWFYI